MYRKITALFLCMITIFTFSACSNVASSDKSNSNTASTKSTATNGKLPVSVSFDAMKELVENCDLRDSKKQQLMKYYADCKYGEFLGAHMVGANVTEMIAECVMARKLETTGHEIITAIHPHPTMSEAVMEAAAAAYGEVIHL